MPATLPPLSVGVEQVRGHFRGVLPALGAVANEMYPAAGDDDAAIALFLTRCIRAAEHRLEQKSDVPFFITRYVTQELARQNSYTLGVNFDKYIEPHDYVRDDWWRGTARVNLQKKPVVSVDEYMLTLANNAQVIQIDLTWIQLVSTTGAVHIIPSGLATAGINFQTLYGFGVWVRGSASGQVPALAHIDFTAGLVSRKGTYADPTGTEAYDPTASPKNTWWEQEVVESYQSWIERYATGLAQGPVVEYITKGGKSISLDGLSETINPEVITKQAESNIAKAEAWAGSLLDSTGGLRVVMM